MKNRIVMVVMVACLIPTLTGCGQVRNFLFGRGARCGLCTTPLRTGPLLGAAAVPAAPTCNTPTYIQPNYAAGGSCGCNGVAQADPCGSGVNALETAYGPVIDHSSVSAGYPVDPYSGSVIGSAVLPGTSYNGAVLSDGFYPADRGTYSSQYGSYPSTGYKVDSDGARILHEDPLPAGARAVN